jgi:hypothetical protein
LSAPNKILLLDQGFTYVAPSVLEEMYKPQVVKARSPRKGMRLPFSPRHPHLLHHTGGFFEQRSIGHPMPTTSSGAHQQEEMMDIPQV